MNLFIQKEEATPFPYNLLIIAEAKETGTIVLNDFIRAFPQQRELTDDEMIILAARGGSFDFLNDERENIYTESNGIPLE